MRRFGASLAGLALYLQLVFASWGMLPPPTQDASADAFGGHALCLAGEAGPAQPTPTDNGPQTPAHDHQAFCCLWHSLPGVAPQAAQAPLPVAYAAITHDAAGDPASLPGPHRGPANARAPPTLA